MTAREKPNAAFTPLRRDAKGTVVCRQCGGPIRPPRETFCSQTCVDRWLIQTDAARFRAEVLRIHGVRCAVCGIAPPKPRRASATPQDRAPGPFRAPRPVEPEVPPIKFFADHRVPLWAGGSHDRRANGQVLCGLHHLAKTNAEAAERARIKRDQDCTTVLKNLLGFPFFGEATTGQLKLYARLSEGRLRQCLKLLAARGCVEQSSRGGPWVVLLGDGDDAVAQNDTQAIRESALALFGGDDLV